MILTIGTSHKPATDLGFLLHKNPSRVQSDEFSFGNGYVVYPEASEERCTVAVVLDVDAVSLVRGKQGSGQNDGLIDRYVNDRPYVSGSFMSLALANFFGTAMSGRSKERQDLADRAIPLEIHLPVLTCRGGESFLRRLFEPLGYQVESKRLPLDTHYPEWGESAYFDVKLSVVARVKDVLTHLYVLLPVLDDTKHYRVGTDEVDKLVTKGGDWLPKHPEKDEITRRYMLRLRSLTREALARLTEDDGDPDPDQREEKAAESEETIEKPLTLNEVRLQTVLAAVRQSGASRVIDLGCGEGKFLELLAKEKQIKEAVGMDVSVRTLEKASRRLRLDEPGDKRREKIRLLHGSLMYNDARLEGFDCAAVIEVIEHLDAPRLKAFETAIFEKAKPETVVVTTPNIEYNALFDGLEGGKLRHNDHRFEWTRAEFESWASSIAEKYGYEVRFTSVGPVDAALGSPTQMGVFTR